MAKRKKREQDSDYDGAWKEAFRRYLYKAVTGRNGGWFADCTSWAIMRKSCGRSSG
jgi:hypothetical protein